MKKTFIILALSALTACASYKSLSPSQKDADREARQFPGITVAELNEGKGIFEASCGKCHGLGKPFGVSDNAFTKIMPSMAKKAHLDDRSKDLVYKYVMTAKSAARIK